MVFHLVLIVLVIHISVSAFKYVKVSLFHHFLILLYSLIMFLITMRWTQKDLILLAILIVVAIALGYLETAAVKFRKKSLRRRNPAGSMRCTVAGHSLLAGRWSS